MSDLIRTTVRDEDGSERVEYSPGATILLTFRDNTGQLWEAAAVCGPLRRFGTGYSVVGDEVSLTDTQGLQLTATDLRVVLPNA